MLLLRWEYELNSSPKLKQSCSVLERRYWFNKYSLRVRNNCHNISVILIYDVFFCKQLHHVYLLLSLQYPGTIMTLYFHIVV